MKIGELARKADSQPATVRYYEELGLLPIPERTQGNYRVYDEAHLERLQFIRNCRSIGMTLEEVRRLLYFRDRPDLACYEINDLLDTHIERLDQQLADLGRLRGYLQELRSCCDGPRTAGDCGILAGLNATTALGAGASSGEEPAIDPGTGGTSPLAVGNHPGS